MLLLCLSRVYRLHLSLFIAFQHRTTKCQLQNKVLILCFSKFASIQAIWKIFSIVVHSFFKCFWQKAYNTYWLGSPKDSKLCEYSFTKLNRKVLKSLSTVNTVCCFIFSLEKWCNLGLFVILPSEASVRYGMEGSVTKLASLVTVEYKWQRELQC